MSVLGRFNKAVEHLEHHSERLDDLIDRHNAGEEVDRRDVERELAQLDKLSTECERLQASIRSRERYEKAGGGMSDRLHVNEPDQYEPNGRPFLTDLYMAQLKNEPEAQERIQRHQRYEVEQRAITSATLGGILPPAYLVELYAKASRGGRVFANEVNNGPLPDVGMTVIIPRLTQGLAAAAQTTQNTAVVTQDVTEADLTVNVNTIAGYSPVSRQGIERAAYSDQILFEDLTARYWSILDSYCLNGTGSNNQPLGLLQTSSISTSTASTQSVAGIIPKIADVIQQVNTAMGGIGYVADKIFVHPRRWGWLCAQVDTTGRPLVMPNASAAVNPTAMGAVSGYGHVGTLFGLDVFVDSNVPITLGATTNADAIIVIASRVVHLLERANDPVTLAFEQTGATALTINLVCYGYAAFTAGRYPAGSGAVTGAGLVPPTF